MQVRVLGDAHRPVRAGKFLFGTSQVGPHIEVVEPTVYYFLRKLPPASGAHRPPAKRARRLSSRLRARAVRVRPQPL